MSSTRLKHRIVIEVLFDRPVTDIEASRCVRSMLHERPINHTTRNRSLSITDAKSFTKVHAAEKLKEERA